MQPARPSHFCSNLSFSNTKFLALLVVDTTNSKCVRSIFTERVTFPTLSPEWHLTSRASQPWLLLPFLVQMSWSHGRNLTLTSPLSRNILFSFWESMAHWSLMILIAMQGKSQTLVTVAAKFQWSISHQWLLYKLTRWSKQESAHLMKMARENYQSQTSSDKSFTQCLYRWILSRSTQ